MSKLLGRKAPSSWDRDGVRVEVLAHGSLSAKWCPGWHDPHIYRTTVQVHARWPIPDAEAERLCVCSCGQADSRVEEAALAEFLIVRVNNTADDDGVYFFVGGADDDWMYVSHQVMVRELKRYNASSRAAVRHEPS